MRIGEFTDSFLPIYDGVGRVVKAYCETLSKMGNEVYAICPMDATGYRGRLGYEIVDYFAVSLTRKLPYKVGVSDFDPSFLERMRDVDLDICHVHSPSISGMIGEHYARAHHVPLIGTFHSKYYDDILKTTKSRVMASIGTHTVVSFFEKCDEVWAVSEGAGETLKSYGYKGDVIVMPNGTERRVLDPAMVPLVREQYHIPSGTPIILFVGQINWKKNLKRVLESCALLKQHGQPFTLVLVGRGPHEDEVKAFAQEEHIDDRLIMTGHIQNTAMLDALYSIADLFLFPSLYDNSPMVLREAANMRTVGLTIRGSCAGEVIHHGENGLLAEDTTPEVARVIEEYLLSPPSTKEKMRQSAYDTIPVPWEGKLMDGVQERYANLIARNHQE